MIEFIVSFGWLYLALLPLVVGLFWFRPQFDCKRALARMSNAEDINEEWDYFSYWILKPLDVRKECYGQRTREEV